MSKWISLTERNTPSPVKSDPERRVTLLEADTTEQWDTLDHPNAGEATVIALHAAGYRSESIWDRFNELPEDANGNVAVNPRPLTVAKRN